MTEPSPWTVGQDVERVLIGDRTRRAHHEIDRTERIVKIARVWLTTVTLDHHGQPTRFETRYRVSTGHEDGRGYTPTYRASPVQVRASNPHHGRHTMSTTPSPSPTRITTLGELKRLPEDAVLMSEKRNRKYGGGRLIRVGLPGRMYGVDGVFTLHKEMRRNLPATVLHNPAAPSVSDTAAPTITREQRTVLARTLATRFGLRHADVEGLGWYEQADAVLAALGLTVTDETGAEK